MRQADPAELELQPPPMRVLVLSKDSTLFSSSRHTFGDARKRHIAYAAALRRRIPGSEIRLITLTPSLKALTYEEVNEGLALYGTSSWRRATYLPGVLKRLRPVLADGWRPDVVTAQTPWEEGTVGLLIARMFDAKFIAQLHFDLFSPEWARESRFNALRRWVAVRNIRRSDGVRVVSTRLKNQLIEQLQIDEGRIHVVPVGVNLHPLNGSQSDRKAQIAANLKGKRVVLFVGRLCHAKNLPLFAEVAERIVRERDDAAFVIAGGGPLENWFRSAVAERNLSPYFHFLGPVGHETLPRIYAAADVLLLTSHHEGFGRVLAESYLCAVPAVSTRCAGPEDVIEHGATGYLCDRDDAPGLAAAVLELLNDEHARSEFGRRGQQLVQSRFEADRLCDQLIDCWTAVGTAQ